MTTGRLGDSRGPHCLLERALHDGLVQMMTTALAGLGVVVCPTRRKYPLPTPLTASARVFHTQRARKRNPTGPCRRVALMLHSYDGEMAEQRALQTFRQHRDAITVALATSHRDLVGPEVDILDEQPQLLEQPHPRPSQWH